MTTTTFDPRWLTSAVLDSARTIYDERVYDRTPILADALMDAGCNNEEILTALRCPCVVHVCDSDPIRHYTEPALPGELVSALINPAKCRADWDREQTRAAKEARETRAIELHRGTALSIGKAYHDQISDLYQSKRGEVQYGCGGEEHLDWSAYGNSYHNPRTGAKWPAKWRNAGARIVGAGKTVRIVIESHRGTEVARLPLPPKGAQYDAGETKGALTAGDLYVLVAGDVAERYGPTKSRGSKVYDGYARTGVAVRFTVPDGLDYFGHFSGVEGGRYWEHGATVTICRAKYDRKLVLSRKSARVKAELDLSAAKVKREARIDRAARLLVRIGAKTEVGYQDCRDLGACDAGLRAFAERQGLGVSDKLPLTRVAELAPEWAVELARRIVERRVGTVA